MWHLTLEAVRRFERANLLVIHEDERDWQDEFEYAEEIGVDLLAQKKQELGEIREEVLQVVPERFHAAIYDDSICLPNVDEGMRADYLNWQREACREFENVLERAYEQKQVTLSFLDESVRAVFEDSLHDAQLIRTEQDARSLRLFLRTGGFSTSAMVVLTFIEPKMTGSLDRFLYYVYDELVKTERGVALKIIHDTPAQELVIECARIEARSFYYPKAYETSATNDWASYLRELPRDARYTWIDANGLLEIAGFYSAEMLRTASGPIHELNGCIYVDDYLLANSVQQGIACLYTDRYEDPYAHFSEPVRADELREAAFSDDLALRTRAWNTMYANAQQLEAEINDILARDAERIDEMMLSVYVRHFANESILRESLLVKYAKLLVE